MTQRELPLDGNHQDYGAAKPPYMRRQDAIRDAVRTALSRPGAKGIFPCGAPTGSGKNLVTAEFTARALLDGADEDGNFKSIPGRRVLVVIIPNKDNRNSFHRKTRELLLAGGLPPEEADERLLRLDSDRDSLADYIAAHGGASARNPIALNPNMLARNDFDARSKALNSSWIKLMRAWRDRYVQVRGLSRNALDALEDNFASAAAALKSQVRRNSGAIDLDVVSRLWPASLLTVPGPKVIVMTPQKWFNPIDPVLTAPIDMMSESFAATAAFIVDEWDQVKSALMGCIVGGASRYDPFDLIRRMHDRFITESSEVSGLITGDFGAWIKVYEGTRNRAPSPPEGPDEAARSRVASIANEVATSYGRMLSVCESEYADMDLNCKYKMDRDYENSQRIFGENDLTIQAGRGKGSRRQIIVAPPGPGNRQNVMTLPDRGSEIDYATTLANRASRLMGGVRVVAGHIQRIARGLDWLHEGDPAHTHANSLHQTIEALGFLNSDDDDRYFRLFTAIARSYTIRDKGDTGYPSVYTDGCGYIELIDDAAKHPRSTYIMCDRCEMLPEGLIAPMADTAPFFVMSATWNAPTVRNWDNRFLDTVTESFCAEGLWRPSAQQIVSCTAELAAQKAGSYRVETASVKEFKACIEFAELSLGSPALRPADQIAADARAELASAFPSSALAVSAMRELVADPRAVARLCTGEDAGRCSGFTVGKVLQALQAGFDWARGVSQSRSYAALHLMPRSLVGNREFAETLENLLLPYIESLRGLGLFPADFDASESIVHVDASTWDDRWPTVEARLARGLPTLMTSAFATAGFSKNMQFPVPEVLKGSVTRVDFGFDSEERMDFDFLYMESPTNRLQIGTQDDERQLSHEERLLAVCEQEQLCSARHEIDPARKRRAVRSILSNARPKYRDLPSARAEGAKTVIQGAGRIMRSSFQLPVVRIMLDPEIPRSCGFGFMDGMGLDPEIKSVIDFCAETEPSSWTGTAEEIDAAEKTRLNRSVTQKDRAFTGKHLKLLNKLMRDGAVQRDLIDFDSERDAALRAFNLSAHDGLGRASRRNLMVESPYPTVGYAFAVSPKGAIEIRFPAEGEKDVTAARKSLEAEIWQDGEGVGWRFGEVSAMAARVPEIMRLPVVTEHFRMKGYRLETYPTGTLHMTPSEFQTVYMGALGEEAAYAIMSEHMAGSFMLSRGDAARAERAGDFLLLDTEGNDTGIWIDVKHYRLASYSNRALEKAYKAELGDVDRFERKADSVGAKKLIIVNLLSDGSESANELKMLDGVNRMFSIPWLVADGKVDEIGLMHLDDAIYA